MECWKGWSKGRRRVETSENSGDDTDTRKVCPKILSKKIFHLRKVYAATELGTFFVTRPQEVANMPSHFYRRVCRRIVFVLTHGHHEMLRYFHGSRHFARDQRLRLETTGWPVLDFHGSALSEDELKRQRRKLRKVPFRCVTVSIHLRRTWSLMGLVLLTRSCQFSQMFCLVDALRMGGSYEPVEKLWAQFALTAGPVNTEVSWTSDEILVGSVNFRNHFVSFPFYIAVLLLGNHLNWNATPKSVTCGWLG